MAINGSGGEKRPATARRTPGMQRPVQGGGRSYPQDERMMTRGQRGSYDSQAEPRGAARPGARRPSGDERPRRRQVPDEFEQAYNEGVGMPARRRSSEAPEGYGRVSRDGVSAPVRRTPDGAEVPRRRVPEGTEVKRRRAPEGAEGQRRRAPEGAEGQRRRVPEGADIPRRRAPEGGDTTRRRPNEGSSQNVRRPADRVRSHSGRTMEGQGAVAERPVVERAPKAKKKSRKTMVLFGVEIIVIVILLGFIYFVRQTSKVEKIRINEEAITIEMNQNVSSNETMKGYRNIALFGVDSREGSLGKGTRSDTIIIASIDQDKGDVKLCSVFRDTYLNLGNDSYNKCNAAYAQGGPEQAVIMLNKNLDMDITDYITVGFDGLIEVIDALGGVEINVTEAEIVHLNNYQISMVGTSKDGVTFTAEAGKDYIPVVNAGKQTLNGLQATAYCRIRYIGNDFQRAQRQRDVITAISEKAKKASVTQLNSVINGVMDNVSTSLDVNEILDVASDLTKYSVVGSDGFPFDENRDTGRVGGKGDCVIPVDLKANVVDLHKFFFNEVDYQVSPEIETFSQKISSDTGKSK